MTHFEKSIYFDFMGVGLCLRSNSDEIIERLSKDFSRFLCDREPAHIIFRIDSTYEEKISFIIPACPEVRHSKNSITYDKGKVRYNDYHGKLISVYDYKNEKGALYSHHIERLHEVTYLLILSRVGKYFDLKGLHKIHALGFIYKGVCCVGMMNMGVGKSTLLMELLKDPEIKLLSDDTPLVNGEGEILAFPIRLGVEKIPDDFTIKNPTENKYSIVREEYGAKELISLEGIENQIGKNYDSLVLFEGHRGDGSIVKGSKLSLWLGLQKHMVIGIGLPIIFEYFWERGIGDFLRKTKIFFLRQRAALSLVNKCQYYKFYLGESSGDNARALKNILSKN